MKPCIMLQFCVFVLNILWCQIASFWNWYNYCNSKFLSSELLSYYGIISIVLMLWGESLEDIFCEWVHSHLRFPSGLCYQHMTWKTKIGTVLKAGVFTLKCYDICLTKQHVKEMSTTFQTRAQIQSINDLL